MRKLPKPPKAKDIQVGQVLFGSEVVKRFEGHYFLMGNYVRFTLADRREVELTWNERAYHVKKFAFESNEHLPRYQPDLREIYATSRA